MWGFISVVIVSSTSPQSLGQSVWNSPVPSFIAGYALFLGDSLLLIGQCYYHEFFIIVIFLALGMLIEFIHCIFSYCHRIVL